MKSPKKDSPNGLDMQSLHDTTTSSSTYIINIILPNGEYVHLPLPQKHAKKSNRFKDH
jgi:hypothetical protein